MKKKFPGYFAPSDAQLTKMWAEAIFVLDANVLLNLYRYSRETREEVFKVLKALKEQCWVPHQAALEFLENRVTVISVEAGRYSETEKVLKTLEDDLKAPRRHPFVSRNLLKQIETCFDKTRAELTSSQKEIEALVLKDPWLDKLVEIFEERIGEPYSPEKLKEIFSEGKQRYENDVPPGYMDKKKPDAERYGDLVVWFQTIDKAAAEKKPTIFITDDAKEDWWRLHRGQTLGPRPELVGEMQNKGKVEFHMYSPDRFLEYAGKFLDQKVQQSTIDEVKEVGKTPLTISPAAAGVLASLHNMFNPLGETFKSITPVLSTNEDIQNFLLRHAQESEKRLNASNRLSEIANALYPELYPTWGLDGTTTNGLPSSATLKPKISDARTSPEPTKNEKPSEGN